MTKKVKMKPVNRHIQILRDRAEAIWGKACKSYCPTCQVCAIWAAINTVTVYLGDHMNADEPKWCDHKKI